MRAEPKATVLIARRVRLNERLLLIGYQVTESGKLARARPAATLSEAQRRADDLRSDPIPRVGR